MPLPPAVARFNRRVTNRFTGLWAGRMPTFGIVVHTGRSTGKRYRTPVNVFPGDGDYVVALTYGPGADWVRNVLAAGGCELEHRGRLLSLERPRVVHDEQRTRIPRAAVRRILGVVGVDDFLVLSPST